MADATPKTPAVLPGLFYEDPGAALDWLTKAFGFELRMKHTGPDGDVGYAEVALGEGVVAVRPTRGHSAHDESPRSLGGANTCCLAVAVDDAVSHCAHAVASGARIIEEPQDRFYGARSYLAEDCEGHRWHFVQPLRDVSPEEVQEFVGRARWDKKTA